MRRFVLMLATALACFSSHVLAFVQGEGEPEGSLHQYNIELQNLDIANNHVGGRTPDFNWSLGGDYVVNFHCPDRNIPRDAIYYSTFSTMPLSSNNTRFKLNEYLDVEVSIFVAGNVNRYVRAPFTNFSNQYRNYSCSTSRNNGTVRANSIESGSKGKVVFVVTKPIINGINITGQALLDLAGDLGGEGAPTTPISRVLISSGVITVPDKCTFNHGQRITVEFGNLPASANKLNGTSYSQNIPIHVQCEGGSFSSGAMNIQLGVQTSTASGTADFNNQLLGTLSNGQKRSDLGIQLKDDRGNSVVPNTFYQMNNFYQNQGDWGLVAAPVANPGAGSVKEGEFEASATVVAQFQ